MPYKKGNRPIIARPDISICSFRFFPASYSGFSFFRPPPGFLVFFILLMQLQRQSIRIVEESHLLAGVIIHADWLAFNPDLCQLIHRLFHAINAERK